MKKNLLLSSFVISALSVNAQITITTADMAVVGGTYIMANDTNVTSFGNAGANQTWNFAAWGNHSKDTISFVSPSSAPGFSNFPTATLAMDADGDGSTFMKNSSSSFDMLGFYSDFGFGPMAVPFTPAQKRLTFPSTYLTNFSGTSNFEVKFYIGQPGLDSMKVTVAINYTSSIDAWGSITTPANSNVNSLRQKYIEISTQTSYSKPTGQPWMLDPSTQQNPNPSIDTSNTFSWLSNTKKWPIAEIGTDANNEVTYASYLLPTPVGVNEHSMANSDVNVFPNPASDKITITGISTESYLIILDVNGKRMESSNLKKNNTSINTSNYENGTYFYQVVGMNGKTMGKGKFVVSK